METPVGSNLSKLIGVGNRVDPDTGVTKPFTKMWHSYFQNVLETFERFPVNRVFGLTPETAMQLPVDRWYAIDKMVKSLPENDHTPKDNSSDLIKLLRDLLVNRGGE